MKRRRNGSDVVALESANGFHDDSIEVEVVDDDDDDLSADGGSVVRERRPSLAALLTEAGIVSEGQVSEALEEGNRTGEKLGEVLVRRGWVSEGRLAQLLAQQWGLTAVDPGALSLDPLAVAKLEGDVASELGGFPIWFDKEGIVVAVAEPSEERFAALRDRLGTVSFVVVPRSTLQVLLDSRVFGVRDGHGQSSTLRLINAWSAAGEVDEISDEAGVDTSVDHDHDEDGYEHLDEQTEITSDVTSPTEDAPEAPAPGPLALPSSIAERLRTIETEVGALEQALADAGRRLEDQESELVALRETREQDLAAIRRLEDALADRERRFQALRERVAALSLALDD